MKGGRELREEIDMYPKAQIPMGNGEKKPVKVERQNQYFIIAMVLIFLFSLAIIIISSQITKAVEEDMKYLDYLMELQRNVDTILAK